MRIITRGKIVQTLSHYYGEYDVSLDVMPHGNMSNYWTNILQVTKGGRSGSGDQMPRISFHPNSYRLYICASIGNHVNHCVSQNYDLPSWSYTNIRVTQTNDKSCMKYRYKIFVNGTLIHAVDNGNPLFLKNVRVYLSNPWENAPNASVKNLKVTTSQGGKGTYYYLFLLITPKVKISKLYGF